MTTSLLTTIFIFRSVDEYHGKEIYKQICIFQPDNQ